MTASVFDMVKIVKRVCKYLFFPAPEQAAELTRTFGCVRKVWNLALQARTTAWHQRHEHVSYLQSSALLTQWKHPDDHGYLNQVSSVPLQQALRHLQTAYARFWQKQARYPRYRSRKKSRASAEYTRPAFRYRDGQLRLATMTAPPAVVWSRPLPDGAEPHDGRRKDFLHQLTTRLVRDNQAVVIEDLSIRNMIRNHHLARAISDAAWGQMRTMLASTCGAPAGRPRVGNRRATATADPVGSVWR
jgi:putative transposase